MFFMSGSQGLAFAAAAKEMTERIRKLGPNPLKLARNGKAALDSAETELEEDNGFRGRRPVR
jgi:hypothetical protein